VLSPQPVLKLGRDVWNRDALPVEEFEARLGRLRAVMSESGAAVALIYGRGPDSHGHVTFFSHYTPKLPVAALLVVPIAGEPSLLFQGASRGLPAVRATTWIGDVRACRDVASAVVDLLQERHVVEGAVAFAGVRELMPHGGASLVADALGGVRVVQLGAEIDRLRAVKSDREIEQVRTASRLAADVLDRIATLAVGRTGREVEADLVHAARCGGAEDVRVMIARLDGGVVRFRPPCFAPVGDGRVAVHLAVARERYWGAVTRTFELRSTGLADVSPGAVHVSESLFAQLRPGRTVAAFAREARARLGAGGVEALDGHGLGHGIGVTSVEPPTLAIEDETPVRAGMCFVVGVADVTAGGALIVRGDTVVVRPEGAMPLTGDSGT